MNPADIKSKIEQAVELLEASSDALREAPSGQGFPRNEIARLVMRARARFAAAGDPESPAFVAGVLACNELLDDALRLVGGGAAPSEQQVLAISAIERSQAILYFVAFRGPDGTPEGRPLSLRPRPTQSARPPAPEPLWSEAPPPVQPTTATTTEPAQATHLALAVQVTLEGPSNFYLGFEEDISQGGLFVATYNRPRIGTAIALSIALPSGHVARAKGAVRWLRDVLDPDDDATPGIGIKLEALSTADHAAITAFTRVRAPMFYDDET